MSKKLSVAVTLVLSIIIGASAARAAEIKLLTTGAFKPEVLALVPDFEKQTGHKVTVDNGTAGELKKRIEGGEVFDVAVITPDVVDDLIAKGKIAAGSRARQRRRRRGGEGGRAQAGREHGRGFQACAAGGEVGCLY